MKFVREIIITTEEEPLSISHLHQLAEEYNVVFQYVCQMIRNEINTWSMSNQEGMQTATIYLSFLCRNGKVVPKPIKMDVRVLSIEVNNFAAQKLHDLLQSYNWE